MLKIGICVLGLHLVFLDLTDFGSLFQMLPRLNFGSQASLRRLKLEYCALEIGSIVVQQTDVVRASCLIAS